MEICQFDKDLRWNIHIAPLIIAINPLAAIQNLANSSLGQIPILTQISNPSIVHGETP